MPAAEGQSLLLVAHQHAAFLAELSLRQVLLDAHTSLADGSDGARDYVHLTPSGFVKVLENEAVLRSGEVSVPEDVGLLQLVSQDLQLLTIFSALVACLSHAPGCGSAGLSPALLPLICLARPHVIHEESLVDLDGLDFLVCLDTVPNMLDDLDEEHLVCQVLLGASLSLVLEIAGFTGAKLLVTDSIEAGVEVFDMLHFFFAEVALDTIIKLKDEQPPL